MEKKIMQARWKDPFFLKEKTDVISKIEGNKIGGGFSRILVLNNEDLAGMTLPCPPASLSRAQISNCNFAFSILDGEMGKVEIRNSNFHGSIFNGSNMLASKLFECDLSDCKIAAFFADAVFESCDFSRTKFSGGGRSGHSGIRAKFINCDFSLVTFKNTILRAVKFINCNFQGVEFINSDMRGTKLENCLHVESVSFKNMEDVSGGIPEWALGNASE
ncbi:pentapeptide repeat-containing protein [Paraburkholderia bonniea]|uniref:pentapeptide repeat-containing protein n=1 Tax=Paraburkholderia bonniea TaxID=2152891 RepID=UPI001292AE29|nr:pentapeptide repeat-containing protein [Paraburkholderia bonniea]